MRDYIFGNFLCSLREKKGYTQAYVAKVLDVTPAAVSKWENGESKPRVEVLLKLANLLDVRAEELIEGRYIPQETLDEDAVRAISDRYEYLRRVDSFEKASVKFKRILAFIIDWNIFGGITLFLLMLEMEIFRQNGLLESAQAIEPFIPILLITMAMYPVGVALRDFIFNGRSLGKRICGLVILDVKTATKPKLLKTILCDLFFFLFQIDFVILLASGKTIGDFVAHTVVVNKKDIGGKIKDLEPAYESEIDRKSCEMKVDAETIEEINNYKPKKNNTKLYVALGILVLCMVFALMFCVTRLMLDMTKNTPEYEVAYNYLVNSETFEEKGYSEDQIRLRSYRKTTYMNSDDNKQDSVEFGFRLLFREYSVVVHPDENGKPFACEECTDFE